jgi:hypothetical protein
MKTTHILLTAGILLALTFTLSCSSSDDPDDPDKGGDGISGTQVMEFSYTKTDESIAWTEPRIETVYSCEDGGTIQEYTRDESREMTAGYTISNNSLSLNVDFRDTINFSGTSSDLVGTWTRTKSQCVKDQWDPGEMSCKSRYNVVKAEFTASKVKFTVDVCQTDWYENGYVEEEEDRTKGRKITVIDCNTIEYSKGTDIVKLKLTTTGREYTYNSKTCPLYSSNSDHYTAAQRAAACKKVWDERGDNQYGWVNTYSETLRADFFECSKGFPSWF